MAWFWDNGPNGAQKGSYLPSSLEPADLSEWVRERRRNLPRSRIARTLLGIAFIVGGVFSFLPILGIWMLPLGLVILSVDWPVIRRLRRQAEVNLVRWWKSRQTVGT